MLAGISGGMVGFVHGDRRKELYMRLRAGVPQRDARPGRYFWSNGYAYGICEVSKTSVRLEVIKGSLDLRYLSLDSRVKPVAKGVSIPEGGTADFEI